jgi:hypothetical protein
MGKTHSKPLAARHGRGTAWARHAMCESALRKPCTSASCCPPKVPTWGALALNKGLSGESSVSGLLSLGTGWLNGSLIFIIIIINIKDWNLWSVPSPELQLLSPAFLLSSNCFPSFWSVGIWFQRDLVWWLSLLILLVLFILISLFRYSPYGWLRRNIVYSIWCSQVRASSYDSNKFNQQDATISQVYHLTFMCGSTWFGRFLAHHQELTAALAASDFTVGAWR